MPTPSPNVRQLAADIIERWTKGETPDTRAALALHPGLTEDKAAVLDLAFAEYWLRVHGGEQVDLEGFCRKFPEYYVSLGRLLAQQSLREKPDELLPDAPPVPQTIQMPATPPPVEAVTPPLMEQPKSSAPGSGSSFTTASGGWPDAGIRIGDYNLLRSMGKGAFSRVYLAREETVDRTVVVKLSRQQCDEARVLGQLGHKNVVSVLSAPHDTMSGLFIIVMPYHGNSTLEDLLEVAFPMREDSEAHHRPRAAAVILEAARRNRQPSDPNPPELAPDAFLKKASFVDGIIWLGVRMAEALSAVHRSGFVHHDLKPSNVLLGLDGQPRLLDFNLATDARNTKSRLGGTLPYMPPEHLESVRSATAADQASLMNQHGDIFSLGVMLYEMLAGVHPFGRFPKSRSVREVAASILSKQKLGVRPIRERNPDVSARLARLVEQCLAFNPKERPASAADVALALRRCYSTQKKVSQFLSGSTGRTAVIASSIGLFSAVGWMASARAGRESTILQVDHATLGHEARVNGQFTEAEIHLAQAAKDQPDNADLRVELARVRVAQGNFINARPELEAAISIRPNDGPSVALYAWTLTKVGDWAAAEKTLRQLATTGYAPDTVRVVQGYVAVQRRQDAMAEEILREALTRKPDNWMALGNLVYLQQMRAAMARQLPPAETFANVERLIRSAPADPQMYLWAARFYSWAISRPAGTSIPWHPEPEQMRAKCREMLRLAVEAGLPTNLWRDESTFRVCLGDPASYSADWKIPVRSETGQSYWRSGNPAELFTP
ncbi:serine/threonine-protein kinase [Zavarzinella formosa]|uniref:serine/threonine-protein kinase n=1 Tax=Zavarzinella formosa TaxID=360055 RepID=UPI0002E56593|nr:serine/threonine-protein kinase [Zavarzinella formosa]